MHEHYSVPSSRPHAHTAARHSHHGSFDACVHHTLHEPQAAYRAWRRAALVETLAALTALQQLPEFNALLEVGRGVDAGLGACGCLHACQRCGRDLEGTDGDASSLGWQLGVRGAGDVGSLGWQF